MAVRKLKPIPKDLIIDLVQRASNDNTTSATYTKIARMYHGSRNDIRPSLDHWVKLGVLSSELINKQTTHWQVENSVIDDMEQLALIAQHQHKTELGNSLDKLSGKKIITKAQDPKMIVKSESDYWKMIFAFQNVSEFYIKLLLQQEKEHDEDNLEYLKVTIRNTMKMINLNRKKLLANRPPHEVTYLEKALDSIPVFDTQFP
jgi:hypothetical protein